MKTRISNVSVWEILACTMVGPLDHKAWCVFSRVDLLHKSDAVSAPPFAGEY